MAQPRSCRARALVWSAATAPANRRCSPPFAASCRPRPAASPFRRAGASALSRRKLRTGLKACSKSCSRPTSSAMPCCARRIPPMIRTGSRKSRPGSSTSMPIRRRPERRRSSRASAFRPRTRRGHVRSFPAAGGCVSRSQRPCSRAPLFCRPLWLEEHLANYPRTVIVISHDRDLLDTSVDQILHLDRGKLTLYRGTYSSFEEQRATREMLDAKHAKRQEAERKRLQAFVDRFKAKASKARQAQSRVKMLEKMKPVSALVTQDVREISFPEPEKMLSPPIIAVDDVSVGYDPKKPVLNRVTLRIDNDDRIALLGANGNGKSTLVKLLANKLPPFSGHVTRAEKLSVGYFAQHQVDELNLDGSPSDHVRKLMPDAPETKVRGRTGAIGFSGKAGDTLVKSLSGGEKARLLLGTATLFGPNMIILDEPTNHLDIDSRAALAEAINEFPGAVIMVSHDRYLIEACADQLWVVADHAVTTYDGDLDDYRRMVLSARGMRTTSRERDGNERSNGRDKPQRSGAEKRVPLKQKISDAEAEIARISGIIAKIDTALALPDLFKRDPKQAAQLSKARASAASALQRAEEEWLTASSSYDEATG